MTLRFTAAYHTSPGLRAQNDDVVGMVAPDEPELSTKGMLAAVADGVSGSDGGREAAESIVSDLLEDYYGLPAARDVGQALKNTIQTINRRLNKRGAARSPRGGMATTLTALVLHENFYHFSHVGDSRLYRLRDEELTQLTVDHVLDNTKHKHVLTRAVGLDLQLAIDQGMGPLAVGDIFLLATDGVWSFLPEHELSWHLSELIGDKRSAEGTAKLLVDAALAAGSKDNLSALVVRIDRLPAEEPSPT